MSVGLQRGNAFAVPGVVLPALLAVFACAARAGRPDSVEAGGQAGTGPDLAPVAIEYFLEPGCHDCAIVSNQVLPQLKFRYEGFYTLTTFDIGNTADYLRLVQYQEQLRIERNEPVCMIVDRRFALVGLPEIQTGLLARVDRCIGEQMMRPASIASTEPAPAGSGQAALEKRARRWTLPFIMVAGLVDGINPCAISALVFFVSLLSLARARARGILLMGISFTVATFFTYSAIGFGLMRFLHAWAGFPVLRATLEMAMIALLAVLAYVSFRDARRFRRSGNPDDITLRLPAAIRDRVHRVMKQGMGFRSLILGGAAVGAVVTALESVCTGQLLVPSLVLIIESGRNVREGVVLLAAYNVMFIVPLVVIFVLCWLGMRTEVFLRWGRANVVMSKILLGVLFLALAAAIIALRGQSWLPARHLP